MGPKPIHRLGPDELQHTDKFPDFAGMVATLSEFPLETAAAFSGAKQEQIISMSGIMPYFSLFSSMYFRALTQGDDAVRIYSRSPGQKNTMEQDFEHVESIHPPDSWYKPERGNVRSGSIPKIGGWLGRRRWFVERTRFMEEYKKFRMSLVTKFQESEKDNRQDWNISGVREWMAENYLGEETADRFWKYFSGVPTGQIRRKAIHDGCAWPLGCVQNLPVDEAPFAGALCQEKEHSRPKIYDPTVEGDQFMCRIHNQWKTSNPLMDLGGILWCIFGE
jgi:hypothetical protein